MCESRCDEQFMFRLILCCSLLCLSLVERPISLEFEPACKFPYAKKGWLGSGSSLDIPSAEKLVLKPLDRCEPENFNTPLLFNDCSMTMAEALGSAYATKCAVYTTLAFVPLVLSCFFLNTMIQNKKAWSKTRRRRIRARRRRWL